MNRHSPLFRVASISLALAVALPLLVFTAAQVRHRQLKSKANPRWAQFAKVNTSLAEDTPTDAPAKSSERPAEEPGTSKRTNVLPVSKSSTPSTVSSPAESQVEQTREPLTPRIHISATTRPAPQETLTETTKPKLSVVPEPDHEPEAAKSRPVVSSKPFVVLRPGDQQASSTDASSSRLEARMAGLQRRIEQLAQLQADQNMSDLERLIDALQARQAQTQGQGLGQGTGQQSPLFQQNNGGGGQLPANLMNLIPGMIQTPTQMPVQAPAPVTTQQNPPPPPLPALTGDPLDGSRQPNGDSRGKPPSIKILQGDSQADDERFSIQVQNANLSEVLDMLGQLAGVNILASREVQGKVSLNLQDVTVEGALDAILRSQGYVHERDGDFIYVRTGAEDAARRQLNRRLISKVYQLHYVNANEVQKLIDPVLTKGIGRHAVTSPAQVGISQSATTAGGDGLAQRDTLVVQDYAEVIAEVDRIIVEIDVPPLQVMIEAKILSVRLSDSLQFGVDFAMLNADKTSQLLTGNGATLNQSVGFPKNPGLSPAAGSFIADTAGLKYGYIAGDIAMFIEALQTIADTTLVASPNLRVLNKQKAEMIIGQRLSYVTLAFNGTQTVQNVNFLDAGTKLIFRPFIAPDGLIRLEVHPERSTATINSTTGLPNQETTEVTTNVMVRDGTTVVIGGLISEEVTDSTQSVPLLGSIPLIGAAFRNKNEQTVRSEMIVLITPHIVREPEAAIEGDKLQYETEERAAYFRDHLSPVNRTSLTRAHYERACVYFEQGNLIKARQQIDAALYQNKGDLECQRLKLQIEKAQRDQQAKMWKWPLSRTAAR